MVRCRSSAANSPSFFSLGMPKRTNDETLEAQRIYENWKISKTNYRQTVPASSATIRRVDRKGPLTLSSAWYDDCARLCPFCRRRRKLFTVPPSAWWAPRLFEIMRDFCKRRRRQRLFSSNTQYPRQEHCVQKAEAGFSSKSFVVYLSSLTTGMRSGRPFCAQ